MTLNRLQDKFSTLNPNINLVEFSFVASISERDDHEID